MTTKLSRNEVRLKYKPIPDPNWTPEIEAEFFARLPRASYRHSVKPSEEKEMLLREFATGNLSAKRLGIQYLSTMSSVLGEFAEANLLGNECLISQRNDKLGSVKTLRTIQAQLLSAGILTKETRSQGHGFVGAVFVYCPKDVFRHRSFTQKYMEQLYRAHEGEVPAGPIPANILPEDIPY